MIKVRVGAFVIGKARGMSAARQMAAMHVMGLVMNDQLATGESIGVEFRCGGQVIETSEMIGPDLDGGLLVL
ncbi:hypothetical protein [Paraburkholderia megapolitana]|uniref:hypothetical protein n=1 Tax=Paraburkholderia megapolitana TaxID=420953 RepID=UPI0038B95C4D